MFIVFLSALIFKWCQKKNPFKQVNIGIQTTRLGPVRERCIQTVGPTI